MVQLAFSLNSITTEKLSPVPKMVDTCRLPKPEYSVERSCAAEIPSELALSLSTTSVACVALICRSLLTSAKSGSRLIASAIFCDHS